MHGISHKASAANYEIKGVFCNLPKAAHVLYSFGNLLAYCQEVRRGLHCHVLLQTLDKHAHVAKRIVGHFHLGRIDLRERQTKILDLLAIRSNSIPALHDERSRLSLLEPKVLGMTSSNLH